MNKIYFIVIDGGADHPIESLGGKTPFEAANTPNLDKLALKGRQSLITVIRDDICPESDSGAMALLSYDPLIYYTGRGPLEGLGAGFLKSGESSIAFRINFASFDPIHGVLDRRTSRNLTDNELQLLASAILTQVDMSDLWGTQFDLYAYGHHRGILGFYDSSKSLSGQVSNTDPAYENICGFGTPKKNYIPIPCQCKPLQNNAASKRGAKLVNEFVKRSMDVLRTHPINLARCSKGNLPANILLVRDGGDHPKPMPSLSEKFGWSISIFGQIPAEKAIAQLIGGDFSYSRRGQETEEEYLLNACKQVISSVSDVVFIHLKGPDEPGHDANPVEKIYAIEQIDKYFINKLMQHIHKSDYIIVTCDHATPCDIHIHSADKVPLVICGDNIESDSSTHFNELAASRGILEISKAIDILPYIHNKIQQRTL